MSAKKKVVVNADAEDKETKKKEPEEVEEKEQDESARKRRRTGAGTWARRYPPSDPALLVRFESIRDIFDGQIGPKLLRQSSFQEWALDGLVRACFLFKLVG